MHDVAAYERLHPNTQQFSAKHSTVHNTRLSSICRERIVVRSNLMTRRERAGQQVHASAPNRDGHQHWRHEVPASRAT